MGCGLDLAHRALSSGPQCCLWVLQLIPGQHEVHARWLHVSRPMHFRTTPHDDAHCNMSAPCQIQQHIPKWLPWAARPRSSKGAATRSAAPQQLVQDYTCCARSTHSSYSRTCWIWHEAPNCGSNSGCRPPLHHTPTIKYPFLTWAVKSLTQDHYVYPERIKSRGWEMGCEWQGILTTKVMLYFKLLFTFLFHHIYRNLLRMSCTGYADKFSPVIFKMWGLSDKCNLLKSIRLLLESMVSAICLLEMYCTHKHELILWTD